MNNGDLHELLMDLNRGRLCVEEVYDTIKSAMCEANSNAVLGEVIDDWIKDLETEDIYILPKLLEKMKSFRVTYFS